MGKIEVCLVRGLKTASLVILYTTSLQTNLSGTCRFVLGESVTLWSRAIFFTFYHRQNTYIFLRDLLSFV